MKIDLCIDTDMNEITVYHVNGKELYHCWCNVDFDNFNLEYMINRLREEKEF